MKRVVVTGAGGFVGRHIVEALLAAGQSVTAVDRAFDDDLARDWAGRLTMHQGDASHLPDIEADALIHGAAITAAPDELDLTPEAHYRANIEPLLSALEWATSHGARRVIAVSSGAVYSQTSAGPISEDQPPTPDNLYAAAKSATEGLIAVLRRHHGRDALTIRLGSVYGPGESARPTRPRVSPVGRMLDEALAARRITLARPDEAREWTYAPDIGRAVARLVSQPVLHHALYNVASGQVLTNRAIAEQIRALLPGTQIRTDADATVPPLTRRGWLANDRLRADTGFDAWTPFSDGLAHVVAERARMAALETDGGDA